jgi:hypothetical protein
LLWLLAVKKTMLFLSLQQWSKHQHLLLTHLPLLLLLTHLPLLLLPMHLPLLLLLLTHQPLLLLMLLLLQLSNLRFNLKLFVKKPSFGLAFFLPVRFISTLFQLHFRLILALLSAPHPVLQSAHCSPICESIE